jgi:hypothetical protein
MKDFVEYILKEARVILGAPIAFTAAVFALGVTIWWFMEWGHGRENSLLRQQVADYKDKLSGASPDQAKARIDELERKFAALVVEVGGRRLTPEQHQTIERGIRVPNGASFAITVSHEGGCPDCIIYGADFERVLRAAGWKVRSALVLGPGNRPSSGVAIGVPDAKTLTPEQLALRDAFRAAKVNFDLLPTLVRQTGLETQLTITAHRPN